MLASAYFVRPRPYATVSTPLKWQGIAGSVITEAFRIDNVPMGIRAEGDLWQSLLRGRSCIDLEVFLSGRQGA